MAKKASGKVEDLTIGSLIARLKPVQLWGMLGAFCVALAGVGGIGHQLGAAGADSRVQQVTAKAEGDSAALKREVEALRERQAKSRGLEEKERFLALYVRYVLAKKAQGDAPNDEELKANAAATSRALEEYLQAGISRGDATPDSEVDFRGMMIHKGSSVREATISFRYDGSVWPIPREFAMVAAAR